MRDGVDQTQTTRQDRVLDQVRIHTQRQLKDSGDSAKGIDAGMLASILHLDRSNISKDLNDLNREGKLIKQQGRPTLFLDRDSVCQAFSQSFIPSVIAIHQQLTDFITAKPVQRHPREALENALDTMIGYDGSLAAAIHKAKAAIQYPPHGLHTLLVGHMGVGKEKFARNMHDYAVKKGILDTASPFLEFNCQDYVFSSQNLISQLVGFAKGAIPGNEKGKRGMIEAAAGGMLYIEGFHKLPVKAQEMMINIIDYGVFTRLGEPSVNRPVEAMLILSTTESVQSDELSKLVRIVPVVIQLPDLDDMSIKEKLAYLFDKLTVEADLIGKPISVKREIIHYLLSLAYPGNIGQMRSVLKKVCSMACLEHADTMDHTIVVQYDHLLSAEKPLDFVSPVKQAEINLVMENLDQGTFIFTPGLKQTLPDIRTDRPAVDLDDILKESAPAENEDVGLDNIESYIEHCVTKLRSGADLPVTQLNKLINPLVDHSVRQILMEESRYQIILEKQHLYYGLLLHLTNAVQRIPSTNQRLIDEQGNGTNPVQLAYPHEYAIAERIRKALQTTFRIQIPWQESKYLSLYLYLSTQWLESSRVGLILICHGQRIAEEMAQFVNQSLGCRRVNWINYHGFADIQNLLDEVVLLIKRIDQGAGVILLTDMEPLKSIHHHVRMNLDVPIESVADISLTKLLDLAQFSMKPGSNMKAIMDHTHAQESGITAEVVPGEPYSPLIQRIITEILTKSLTFIDPYKSAYALLDALNKILDELSLPYSDEIAIKFIFHCAVMFERVIKKEPFAYQKLRSFINRYSRLMALLDKHISSSADVFGISVPSAELAFVAEIFIPYME